jgi:hypothetical protein
LCSSLSFLCSVLWQAWIMLIICTSLCPSTLGLLCHLPSVTRTACFSSGLLPFLGQVKWTLLACIVTQTHTLLSINVSANLTQLQKCFARCKDSSQNFCLEVIILCPPSLTQLRISPCYTCNLILPHAPFSPALHVLLSSLDCKC